MDIKIEPLNDANLKEPPRDDFRLRQQIQQPDVYAEIHALTQGWHEATIGPYAPFQLDPATAVFHYAQEIFEGTKAYRRDDGRINLFRPWENMKRFNRSATAHGHARRR
jgi:branched-chain amino acid aminotransferase